MSTLDHIVTSWIVFMIIYFFIFAIYMIFANKKITARIQNPFKRFIFQALPVVFLFFIWFIGFGLAEILEYRARLELKEFIKNDTKEYSVKINNTDYKDSKKIIENLRKVKNIFPHNSHPTDKFEVLISSQNDSITAILGKDSDREDEYWVFLPKYRHTALNEIGRITMKPLDIIKN